MERAKPIMASPSMVSLTECVSRTKSLRPHAASSFRTCSLTVDCLRFRLAPASVKLRVRATATKLFSQLGSSITLDIPIYDNSNRSEEHTSELQSLMRISYAVFCLKKKIKQ